MKKIISVILFSVLLLGALSFNAGAYRIGDVVGYALTTDIAATINGYDIPSYNVDGYTYIVVEDLRYYGFSVNYDNASRSLSVTRDASQQYVSKVYTKEYVSPGSVGARAHKLLYTDIVTYFDGYYVNAFNINGQTIVRFDTLAAYGAVSFDNNNREISAVIPGLASNPYPVDRTKMRQGAVLGQYEHVQYDAGITIFKYDGNRIEFEIVSIGQNGNRIAYATVDGKVNNGVCYFYFDDSWGNTGNGMLEIKADGTLSLSFYDVDFVGLWGVSCGEGNYRRIGDVPANYQPMF